MKHNRAFTLLEMMVVVAIVAVLLALLWPALGGARTTARMAVCQSNLHQLGEALQLFRVDHIADRNAFTPESWVPLVMPYTEGGEGIFVCPEDEDPQAGLSALVRIGVFQIKGTFVRELITNEAIYIAKLSEEQYQANPPQPGVFFNAPTYEPGTNPHIYYYCVEDKGETMGDSDFDDVIVRVQENEDGSFDLQVKKGTTAYRNKIIYAGSRKVLISLSDAWQDVHVEGIRTSYGMNALTPPTITAGHNLLLVDYPQPIAGTADDWEEWREPTGQYEFARHHGQSNILFGDLSVEVTQLPDFDPRLGSNVTRYWMP